MPPTWSGGPDRRRGHRTVAHTADVILEAWGPDLSACVEEAVAALVACYADPAGAEVVRQRSARVAPGTPEDVLLDVVDEVLLALDTEPDPPVAVRAAPAPDGGLDLVIDLAARGTVAPAGAAPKAVSRSELSVSATDTGVRCRMLVDV